MRPVRVRHQANPHRPGIPPALGLRAEEDASILSQTDRKWEWRASTMKRLFYGLLSSALLFGAIGQARSDSMYWTDLFGGDIRRANLDGTGQQTLVTGGSPGGIALDLSGGLMYWTDYSASDIRRANLDGTGQQTLVTGLSTPFGIALDLSRGLMYWAERGGYIRRANLDGTGQQILIRQAGDAVGIALDLSRGLMYWGDASGSIQQANLDGSGHQYLITGQTSPRTLALDLSGGKIYWADFNEASSTGGDIRRANLDGTAQETLVSGLNEPAGPTLDLVGGRIYWADFGGGDIRRANLDGTGQETLVRGLSGPAFIALDISVPVPVLVTGYSADVISDKDPSARFAQAFDSGTFAWFESGAVDDNGVSHDDGLPAGLTFVSATGSGATYQIQPPNANNVLQLGASQTGTLTLTTAAAYSTLYVLASSGDGTPSSAGSGTITFADRSTQAFSYNCFDWCNGQGGSHPEAVLGGPNGRADVGPTGTAFVYNQDCDFQIYETVIPLDSLHAGVAIASIDFTGAPDAFLSNIFSVSGR
jgi:DNA-binding beta-propeller fold protein YncE